MPEGMHWVGLDVRASSGLRFDDRASELCFADYLHAHDVLLARRERLDATLAALAQEARWPATIDRLRCLRGIDTLSALGLCAEVSDFGRVGSRQALGAYLGPRPVGELVRRAAPQARSRRTGPPTPVACWLRPPTRTGVRRAARPPSSGASAARRLGRGLQLARAAAPLRAHATAAAERGKGVGVTAIAVARELSGFCWELAFALGHPCHGRPRISAGWRGRSGAASASLSTVSGGSSSAPAGQGP
jgi:transposase